MPAECEINGCGVLAGGRCLSCNSAFCPTHQGRTNSGNTKYIDKCCRCVGAANIERTSREHAKAAADRPDLLRQVVETMVDHNVGGLENRTFRWKTTRTVERPFRKPIEHRDVHEFVGEPAWPIGPIAADETSPDCVRVYRECGITKKGHVVLMLGGIRPSPGTTGGYDKEPIPLMMVKSKYGPLPPHVLDADLRSLDNLGIPKRKYKLTDKGLARQAVIQLDGIARDHGLDLAEEVDWPNDVVSGIRS